VCSTVEAKLRRQREHPLADRDLGRHPVHEMRDRVRHPRAGGAEAATLARAGGHAIDAARVAVHADEAAGKDAAVQKVPELALDEG
jgi:hypothetical protein